MIVINYVHRFTTNYHLLFLMLQIIVCGTLDMSQMEVSNKKKLEVKSDDNFSIKTVIFNNKWVFFRLGGSR